MRFNKPLLCIMALVCLLVLTSVAQESSSSNTYTDPATDIGVAISPQPPANLARNKFASQSSTATDWGGNWYPSKGVDGIKTGNIFEGGFHTNNEVNPWWQVDLGAISQLTQVRIYNRLDCCSERSRTLQVLLSDEGQNWRVIYSHDGSVFGGADGNYLDIKLNNEIARFVRVQLRETNWLHLDEVEVYGVLDVEEGEQSETDVLSKGIVIGYVEIDGDCSDDPISVLIDGCDEGLPDNPVELTFTYIPPAFSEVTPVTIREITDENGRVEFKDVPAGSKFKVKTGVKTMEKELEGTMPDPAGEGLQLNFDFTCKGQLIGNTYYPCGSRKDMVCSPECQLYPI
jgi:hypothetical protein